MLCCYSILLTLVTSSLGINNRVEQSPSKAFDIVNDLAMVAALNMTRGCTVRLVS